MHEILTLIASTATAQKSDVMATLGIDWMLLAFQLVAFLILVWLMSKFVFPVFTRVIDQHRDAMEASAQHAIEAEKNAEKSKQEMAELLKQARAEAGEIVASAKSEANAMVEHATEKSKLEAERIVAAAHEDIDKQIVSAKRALHDETIELVASATEKVTAGLVNARTDKALIEKSLASDKPVKKGAK